MPSCRHLLVCLGLVLLAEPAFAADFIEIESGQSGRWRSSPDGTRLFAVNTPDGRLEIFDVGAGPRLGALRCRSASSRSRSPRVERRGLGRQPPLRQRQHRRPRGVAAARSCARCSSATSRATSCSPAPAATRAFITTAHRGQHRTHPSIAARAGRRRSAAHDRGRRPRRRLGLRRRRNLGDGARRHAAADPDGLRRHAARARGQPDGGTGLRRRSSTRATRRRRSRGASSATASTPAGGLLLGRRAAASRRAAFPARRTNFARASRRPRSA